MEHLVHKRRNLKFAGKEYQPTQTSPVRPWLQHKRPKTAIQAYNGFNPTDPANTYHIQNSTDTMAKNSGSHSCKKRNMRSAYRNSVDSREFPKHKINHSLLSFREQLTKTTVLSRKYTVHKKNQLSRTRPLSEMRSFRPRGNSLYPAIGNFQSSTVLNPREIQKLYIAKCADMKLQYFPNQEARFHEFCSVNCVDRSIAFREIGLGIQSARVLNKILKKNHKFSVLDLRKNQIGDEGIKELFSGIKLAKNLVHLDLSSNDITAKGGEILFWALCKNESITSLDISSREGLHRNTLFEDGMRGISQLLQTNKTLMILNLSGNDIKIEGLKYVAEGFNNNHTLVSLSLANNKISGSSLSLSYLKQIILHSKLLELLSVFLSSRALKKRGLIFIFTHKIIQN